MGSVAMEVPTFLWSLRSLSPSGNALRLMLLSLKLPKGNEPDSCSKWPHIALLYCSMVCRKDPSLQRTLVAQDVHFRLSRQYSPGTATIKILVRQLWLTYPDSHISGSTLSLRKGPHWVNVEGASASLSNSTSWIIS